MALIKHAQATLMAREAVVLDLGDLRNQGEAIIAQARARAAEIIREAEAERDRIVAGASQKGHAEGSVRGEADGRAKGETAGKAEALATHAAAFEALCAGWTDALSNFESIRQDLLDAAQHDVVQLALLIAERVTKRLIQSDPSVVVSQVSAALGLVLRSTSVTISVHPDDLELVRSAMPTLAANTAAAKHSTLRQDSRLSRGSCVVRSAGAHERLCAPQDSAHATAINTGDINAREGTGGEIDASIEVQLDRIAELIVPVRSDTPQQASHKRSIRLEGAESQERAA